jgi:hypothetical protein
MPRSKIAQHALVTHMLEAENPNWSILSTDAWLAAWTRTARSWWVMNGMCLIEVLRCCWIQAGSYRLPIHLAKPARPISEGTDLVARADV